MGRRALVTDEGVNQAVEALLAEKLEPTVERIRAKLGGGSYTTINRALVEVLKKRQTPVPQVTEVPADLVQIGQRAAGEIYAAVHRQADARVELIETEARKKIELIETDARTQIGAADQARADAALEVEKLEREVETAAEALAAAQTRIQDALARAAGAEATAAAGLAELQRLERALVGAQADAQSARESDQEAQKRAARSEEARRAFEAETRQELERLQKALAQAETKAEQLATRAEDLKATLSVAQAAAQSMTAEVEAERQRHAVTREALTALNTELVTVKAKAEAQAGVQAEQVERLKRLEAELTAARDVAAAAREEAAKLAGGAEALTTQHAELMRVIEGRASDRPKGGK